MRQIYFGDSDIGCFDHIIDSDVLALNCLEH